MSLAPIHRYIGRIIHLIRKEKGMRQSELALLTGLKQPNLSRIENGLVSPRQVTLEKIAKALGVEVQVFYSESKVQEVERKWAASLGPKHAALMMAGKLQSVPVLDTANGYNGITLDASGEAQGRLEVVMQMPPGKPEEAHHFSVRVHGDAMHNPGSPEDFRPGELVVFAAGPEVQNGDFAFVFMNDSSNFRRILVPDTEHIRLQPLNPTYEERVMLRSEIRAMYKLVRYVRSFN